MRHALILAGGSGTRLWPFSTAGAAQAARAAAAGPLAARRRRRAGDVGRAGRAGLARRGRAAARGGRRRSRGCRPTGWSSSRPAATPSPAVALGCAVIAAADPDAVVAVLTADHLIEPLEVFAATLDAAFALAEARDDALVTFGVVPGPRRDRLRLPRAGRAARRRRLDGDDVPGEAEPVGGRRTSWPPGRRATCGTPACSSGGPRRCCAPSTRSCRSPPPLLREMGRAYGTPAWDALARDGWPTVAKTSIDYGVMEPASTSPDFTVAALPLAARWLDVGSWPAYGSALEADADGNQVGAARAVLHASRDNVVASSDPDHLVALVGCEGLVVVHTPTATLVMPAARGAAGQGAARPRRGGRARAGRDAPRAGLLPPC